MTTEAQAATAGGEQTTAPSTTTQTQAAPVQTQVPTQAPQSAASAATPAAEAKATEPGKSEEAAPVFGEAITYQPTGNSNLDAALTWAGKLGLAVETSPEMQAATKGNFAPLRALLAAKQIPGSEAYIALAEAGYKEAAGAKLEQEKAVQQIVVNAAGGEDQWAEVFSWARENAEPAEKEQINAAFEQGGLMAEAMAALLVSNFRAQPGVSVPAQGDPVRKGATAAPVTNGGPLSPAEYGKAVAALRQQLGGRQVDGSPEYAALQRRRAAWRG